MRQNGARSLLAIKNARVSGRFAVWNPFLRDQHSLRNQLALVLAAKNLHQF